MRYIFASHDRPTQIAKIREGIAEYRALGESNPGSLQMHLVYDDILRQLADHFLGHWKDRMAVIGLGGYGRTEMSPYSDIDLLFLRPEQAPEGIYRGIRSILYLLWDARVEVGHSVRTVAECTHEADKDLAVLTSLMDTRYVWGDGEIFRQLRIQKERLILETDPLELYLKIEAEIRKSYERFGHTIYLLEPHLKEGPGSLRYIQLIGWLVRIVFGCNGFHDLPLAKICGRRATHEAFEGMAFLAEVRARLHFLAGRRDDRLKFDAQTTIAEQMGFADTKEHAGVEHFMREYYRHAATMDFFGRRVLARARLFLRPKVSSASETKRLKLSDGFYLGAGGINHYDLANFGNSSLEILQAFLRIAETRCDLDIRLVDRIRAQIGRLDLSLADDPECSSLFLRIFQRRGSVARALNAMMKIGLLERFIPEFAWIRFLPQHDVYHQYTVDLHTIAVLENIDSFGSTAKNGNRGNDTLLRSIFSRLEKPELLYLAGLFHDIAKGRGAGHEVRGEEIARNVLVRLGLPQEDVEEVCFLIRNHLAMTHLAFKKDLHDEALVSRFAENIMEKDRLDLLLLLTHADLRAVGPTAFNSWRDMLLEELYYRTLDTMEGEGEGEDLSDWIKQIKAVVVEKVPVEMRTPLLDKFLEQAPTRYFLDFYPGTITEHYQNLFTYLNARGQSALSPTDMIAEKTDHRRPGYSAISLLVQDRRGLFFRIAGTLFANRINILSAWSHSIGDLAVATLHVNDIPEGPVTDPERWAHFQEDFGKVISGEADVDQLVAVRRAARRTFGDSFRPRFPLKVEVDNAASDRATIVEVYAHDRPGLLYDITRGLSSLGLNIVLTKITTEIDQALDVFYVQDENGAKVIDFERLDDIRDRLHEHLKAMEDEHFGDQKEPSH